MPRRFNPFGDTDDFGFPAAPTPSPAPAAPTVSATAVPADGGGGPRPPRPTGPAPTPTPGGGGGGGGSSDCPPPFAPNSVACQRWKADPRFDINTWQDWVVNYHDPACPGDEPFRSAKTIPGWSGPQPCVGKPDDCPPGYRAFGKDQCLPESHSAFGGGGGPAAGGGGGVSGRPAQSPALGPSMASTNFGAELEAQIRSALNAPSRYTPEALQALYGEIARQSAGSIRRGERAVRQNAAQRNMQRAGSTAAALRGVRDAAEQQRGASVVGVQTAKINADHADKLAALDRAQRYLDSLRDNEYRYMLMGEQRRQFDANLALAYANLNQQRSLLQMQLQSQWDMLRANQGFWLIANGGV